MCDNSTAPDFQLPTPTQNLGIGDWELGIDGIRSKASRFGVIAFVFPGQGAQKVGMGRTLVESFPEARAAFEEADDAFGEAEGVGDVRRTLSTLCFEGPEDRLGLTEVTQPAMLTASVAACRVLQSRGIHPAFVA